MADQTLGMTSSAIRMRMFKLRQKARAMETAERAAGTGPMEPETKAAARATGCAVTHRQAVVDKVEILDEESPYGDGPASACTTTVPRKTGRSRVPDVEVEEGENEEDEQAPPAPSDTSDATDLAITPEPRSDSDEKAQLATPESPTPPARAALIRAKTKPKKAQKAVTRARSGGAGRAEPRAKAPSAVGKGTKTAAKTAVRRVESGRVEKRRSLPRGAANKVSYAKLHDPFDESDQGPDSSSDPIEAMDVDGYGLDSDGEFFE